MIKTSMNFSNFIFVKKKLFGRVLRSQKYLLVGIFNKNTSKIRLRLTSVTNVDFMNNFIAENIPVRSHIITHCWGGFLS